MAGKTTTVYVNDSMLADIRSILRDDTATVGRFIRVAVDAAILDGKTGDLFADLHKSRPHYHLTDAAS